MVKFQCIVGACQGTQTQHFRRKVNNQSYDEELQRMNESQQDAIQPEQGEQEGYPDSDFLNNWYNATALDEEKISDKEEDMEGLPQWLRLDDKPPNKIDAKIQASYA
ncbi:hypothetical protein PGT21_013095 [Puccinia graminis f. sp. tritici]|uniref:Uncharacterized protein n=1 Tax=Puccinia graminis f. sp. tritici TaxID=56615 RepID=A0A5B0R0K3_PUCGR|nr:hypothetical protein PGT21_013095 [Puccinia graminis f. sp. tritici]